MKRKIKVIIEYKDGEKNVFENATDALIHDSGNVVIIDFGDKAKSIIPMSSIMTMNVEVTEGREE